MTSPQKIRHLDQIMTQALEVTGESVASWVCVTRLYQKFKAVLWFIWIHWYHFLLCPSFNNHHSCMTSPKKLLHCWPNHETGHWGHWWVSYFISMCNKLVPKYSSVLWFIWIQWYYFLFCPSFDNHHYVFHLFQIIAFRPNHETGPWGHWRVCCFMSMCDKIVPKIKSCLMVHMNLSISFFLVSKLQ